jgi:Cys-tRNA(Pro) deacylase
MGGREMETSVTRFLDDKGIAYEIRKHQTNVYTCEDAARERGVKVSQIVKCMIGRDPHGSLHVMLIPGDKTLKLKRVRQVAGGIRIDLVPPDQIAKELGLIVGAISPTQLVGLAKFYIDNSVFDEEYVDISTGSPDAGVEIAALDLGRILEAVRCDIISTSER